MRAQFVFVVFACCARVQLQVRWFLQSMPANAASDCALVICLREHACTICFCCVCLLRSCADVAVAMVTVASPENSPDAYPEFPLTLAQPDPYPASQSDEESVCRPHQSSPTYTQPRTYIACTMHEAGPPGVPRLHRLIHHVCGQVITIAV